MRSKNHIVRTKEYLATLLENTGITLDGPEPWDIRIKDERFLQHFPAGGSLALGESYMDGWWDVDALDEFFTRAFAAGAESDLRIPPWLLLRVYFFRVFNAQAGRRAFQVGRRHYDVGNDLFKRMLDKRMVYSCGYWKEAQDLDSAQVAKLDMICRKLRMEAGMRLLDIGCGWGSLLRFAVEQYAAEGHGVTVSREQARLANECNSGLPVEVRLQDYRKLRGQYDAIASIGMVEHAGWKNYPKFMQVASRCLRPGGLFVLQTIGSVRSVKDTDPWIGKYIFPNSMLPSLAQLASAAEPYFVIEDVQNFGPDYDRTLMAWDQNFRQAWPELKGRYGERFYRMWRFYLMSSAASFRTRRIQLWQLVLAKKPGRTRYDAPR